MCKQNAVKFSFLQILELKLGAKLMEVKRKYDMRFFIVEHI